MVLAVLTLIQFHCLLRAGEARALSRADLVIVPKARTSEVWFGARAGGGPGREPKTRRQVLHAKHQHVLIECEGAAAFVSAAQSSTNDSGQNIWQGSHHLHYARFRHALDNLGIGPFGLTLAALRGGGATDHWLRYQDIPRLTRRGRWSCERTLERHVQEGTYCLRHLQASTSCLELVNTTKKRQNIQQKMRQTCNKQIDTNSTNNEKKTCQKQKNKTKHSKKTTNNDKNDK